MRSLRSRAREILAEADRRLRLLHKTAPLGNKADPLDELIFIQLSVRTRESAYEETYRALYKLVEGEWSKLLTISDNSALQALRGGGMAEVKLKRFRNQIRAIQERFNAVTLQPLFEMADDEAERFLRSLPGVGPKVARCVLMYSLDRKVFPVDSHCRRIMRRLKLLPSRVDRKAAHDFVQDLVPRSIRKTLHVNLVHHGRAVCLPERPLCIDCSLIDLCPTGKSVTRTRRCRAES